MSYNCLSNKKGGGGEILDKREMGKGKFQRQEKFQLLFKGPLKMGAN